MIMSQLREGCKADFKRFYEQFLRYPPLPARRESLLLHVIKGRTPPAAKKTADVERAMDELWETRDTFSDFIDRTFASRNGHGKNGKPTLQERDEAMRTFLLHNMRLVLSRVLKLRSQEDSEAMTLVSFGLDGLLRAIKLFDLNRGTRFSTYAVHWIDSMIKKGILSLAHPRPPVLKRLTRAYKRAEKTILLETGQKPDCLEVAGKLRWGSNTLTTYQTSNISNVPADSFDAPCDEPDVVSAVAKKEIEEALHRALPTLSPMEEEIIRRHFGVGYPEETLQSLAAFFRVTKERIRQIENGGLEKLYLKVRRFRDSDD